LVALQRLDEAIAKALRRKAKEEGGALSEEEKIRLMSTEEALSSSAEAKMPSAIAGLENFSFSDTSADKEEDAASDDLPDADSLFNLPSGGSDDDEEDDR
ncbi:MAG: DUF1013 domain-containing protein, partial [Rubricella sp.]